MGIEAISVALDGTTVVPVSDDEWQDWVSPTALRGFLVGDTLSDWLNYYGEARGFVRATSRRGSGDSALSAWSDSRRMPRRS